MFVPRSMLLALFPSPTTTIAQKLRASMRERLLSAAESPAWSGGGGNMGPNAESGSKNESAPLRVSFRSGPTSALSRELQSASPVPSRNDDAGLTCSCMLHNSRERETAGSAADTDAHASRGLLPLDDGWDAVCFLPPLEPFGAFLCFRYASFSCCRVFGSMWVSTAPAAR